MNFLDFIFAWKKAEAMEYAKEKNTPRCLECGDKISYGRTDKKFCSEECKNHHHNQQNSKARTVKRRVMAALDRNYAILDGLVRSGVDSIWIADVLAMGFNPGFATSFIKGRRGCMYSCFDISYLITDGRLSSISKIQNLSVNLQAGHDQK